MNSPSDLAVQATGLVKTFGAIRAVDGVDLAVPAGSVYAVIDHGTVIAEGTSGELKASVGTAVLHLQLHDPADRPRAEQILARILNVPVRPAAGPAGLTARVPSASAAGGPGEELASVLAALARASITITEFTLAQPQLEEVFLALTGRPATSPASKDDAA